MMLRAIMAKCSFLFFVSFMNLGFLKIAFFFHFLFTFSRAHLKRAFARAYNITFFFCVRARTRARKSHALLSPIDLSSIDLYR